VLVRLEDDGEGLVRLKADGLLEVSVGGLRQALQFHQLAFHL